MSFMANNTEYSVVTNAEIADVIAHFSSEMIMDIVDKNLLNRLSFTIQKANLVYGLEEDFKQCFQLYPAYYEEFSKKRFTLYSDIIQKICNFYDISCLTTSNVNDLHSRAFYLYDIFVSSFSQYVVRFFANYIIREKNALYDFMEAELTSKGKDYNTIYSKKVYNNSVNHKLVALHANLDFVVDNICAFDINIESFISNALYGQPQIIKYLTLVLSENNGDLFSQHIVPFVQNKEYKATILTYLRFALQEIVKPDISNYIKDENINSIEGE